MNALSSTALLALTITGLVVTALASTGVKVLREFSRGELEEYCRRRNRRERFGEILDHHDDVALGAESWQIVGLALLLISGACWALDRQAALLPPTGWQLGGLVAIGAAVLLVVVVWFPWAIVRVWSAPFLYHSWGWWWLSSRLVWPLSIGAPLIDALTRRLAGRHDEEEDEEEAFEEEIRAMMTEGSREGLLEHDAREMIESVIELSDVEVSEIMTPRSEVDAVDVDLPWPDVLRFVVEVGRTRIPVYEGDLDHVIGILYAKDLLQELTVSSATPRTSLRELLRPAWFIPDTKAVDELLREFLRTRSHMAIVVDEYQAVAGVVTIEDALEEIVGEIADESDEDEEAELVELPDGAVEAAGRVHIHELNERLGLGLPDPEDYDTIAGFLISQLGRIPEAGAVLDWHDLRLTVLEATRRRVDRVRIERLPAARQDSA